MKTDSGAEGKRDSDKPIAKKKSRPSLLKSDGRRTQPKAGKPTDNPFMNIIERINEGFASLDAQLNYVYINQRGIELLERKPEELIGKNYSDIRPQDKDTALGRAYLLALKTQTPVEIEYSHESGEHWFEHRIYPSESGLSIFFNEITERKQAETRLRQSEERFRILSNTVPSMVWSTSADGTIQYVNEHWHSYTGLTMEESIANWQQLLHPDDVERVLAAWNHALVTMPDEYEMEVRYRRHDGTYRWFQSRAVPARDEHGNVTAWYGVTTDIHNRYGREAELESIIHHTPFMLTRCTRDLRYRYISRAYAEMLGRTPEEVLGKPIIEIMGEAGLKTIMPFIEKVLQGTQVEYETEVSFEGVGEPVLHVIYTPDYDEQGTVVGWFASITDVTVHKMAGKEKIQLLEREQVQREHAEQARAEAERELAERKMAEEALGMWTSNPLLHETRSLWMRYGIALLATSLAILLRMILVPVVGDFVPLATLFGAVAFSVWYGGAGPALLSVIVGFMGAEWFIIEPHYMINLDLHNMTGLGLFLFSSLIVISLGEEMRRAQRHAHQSAQVAVARQQQLQLQLVEQRRVEEALRESERKFNLIYEKLPFAAALSRPQDGILVDVNKAFEDLFGYSRYEVLGKNSLELGINRDTDVRTQLLSELQARGTAHDVELKMFTKSGDERVLLLNIDHVNLGEEEYVLQTAQDITERKQAQQALAEFDRQQQALYNLSEQLHQTKSLEDVFHAALDAILNALQCDRASILLFDDTNVMSFVAWSGLSDDYRKATDGHSPWKADEKTPEPICLHDVNTAELSESLRAVVKREGIGSLAFIPLVSDGRLIGKFMAYFNVPHAFDEDETELSLTIARQLAVGIERKRDEAELRRAREQAEKSADRMARLQQITATLTRSATPKQMAESILEQGTQLTDAVAGILVEVLENGEDLKTVAALGYPIAAVRTEPVPLSAPTPMSDCIRNRQAIWIGSQAEFAAQYPALAEARQRNGNESTVALPLIAGERVLGGLAFSFVEARTFELEERNFFLAVAERCAQALERNRTQEQLKNERELLERLFDTMPVMVSIYDPATNSMRLNAEFERLIGWKSEEVSVRSMLEALYPDPEYRNNILQQMAASKGNDWVEVQVHTRAGHILDSLWSNISIMEGEQLVTGIAIGIDITERKQAERRLTVLAEISELMRKLDDPGELTYAVAKAVGQHLQVRRCLFNETDVEKDLEIVQHDYHNGVESVAGVHKLSEYSSSTSAEISAGKTVINYDSKVDPRTAPDYERSYEPHGERAYVAVPLMRENRWVGTLWVSDDAPRQWSTEEVNLLETIAERTWTVIEKLRINTTLRASEQLYRTIARSIPGGGVYVIDKDFRYIVADGPVTAAFGLTREMLEGHTVSEVFPPEASARMEERLRRTFAGGIDSFETRHNERVYWTQQAPLRDSLGNALIVTLDITERKQAEDALRHSEERFTRFMQYLPGLAWIKDLEGRYVYANAAAEKAFNVSRANLYGRTDREIFPPEVTDQFTQNDQRALHEGQGIQVVETLPHEDGMLHYSLVSKFPIPGPDGNAILIGGTAFDITERKQAEAALEQLNLELESRVEQRTAELRSVNDRLLEEIQERTTVEEALRESDETTRLILDTSPDVIVIANKRGQIRRVNAQIEKLFGYPSAEVIGKQIEALIPQRFHERLIERRSYYYENPHQRPMGLGMDLFGQRKDGTEFSVDVMLTPIHHIADWETMVTIRDSTDRRQMEDALRESHRRLQSLSKRLVEVQEDERRAIARELHDRVGQSLAALNLNLTIVNNQLSSLVNEQVNARLSDSLNLVAELIALVRDVMSNLRPAVLDDFGLEAALQSHLDSFKARYGIGITFDKNQSLIPRLGSSVEMTLLRIAQEALLNVVRHAQADQVVLSLQLAERAIRMTVQDNGIGIQSWHIANYPGSHGLMIMRERAEAVGGNLRVSSAPGKGTQIEASIPFQEKASQDEHP